MGGYLDVLISTVQVHPAWPGCFGAKYREKKSRGRFGPLIDCVSGKSNNLVIAPDGVYPSR
jgi:hypothetical protein